MKEKEFINIIKDITNTPFIGDDCACLDELGIVISQDNLVEDIHFSTKFATPYQIGYKAAMVNISDIAASGAKPEYLSIGLSIPNSVDKNFIKNFYQGIKDACNNISITGGDITYSDKIYISICAIGKINNRKISKRSNAKVGYKIIISGNHGSSGAGLRELLNGNDTKFNQIHLMPQAQLEFSEYISTNINTDYAMMDTSDGLMDALNQIAVASNVTMSIDFNKIPYDKDLEKYNDFKNLIFYGGEDYQLVACVPEEFTVPDSFTIGYVEKGLGVKIDGKYIENSEDKIYNHFKEQ